MPQLGFQSDPGFRRVLEMQGESGSESPYAVFLAGFLPSQSVASSSDRSLSERGRS